VNHEPGGRLPLLSARPAVTPATLKRLLPVLLLGEQGTTGVNSLPKTVTRQRRDCDLNPGPSAPESSTLTTRLFIENHDVTNVGYMHIVVFQCDQLRRKRRVQLLMQENRDIGALSMLAYISVPRTAKICGWKNSPGASSHDRSNVAAA